MTRKYMTLSSEKRPMPFLLKPAGKDYLWGGNRLNDDFSKGMDMEPLAETWECSTHPDGVSVAGSGSHEGIKLTEILKAHPEYMGRHRNAGGELPILVKFIDAKKTFLCRCMQSVQAH